MKLKALTSASLLALATFTSVQAQANDLEAGKELFQDANCMSCHGAKGHKAEGFTDLKDYKSIVKTVKFCNSNLNAGYFDDEELLVADYLNHTYYHFKK